MSSLSERTFAEAEAKGASIKGLSAGGNELALTVVNISNLGVLVLSLYGAYEKADARVVSVGAAFFGAFLWARERGAGSPGTLQQLALVLSLVALSFCLHFLYLPAGLCCFVVMMMTKNEMLLPPKRTERPAAEDKRL